MNQSKGVKLGRWLRIALYLFLALALMRAYFRLTDDFRIANITHEIPYHSEWETAPLSIDQSASLARILDQKFSYIGKGAQSYVFGSEDQQYVIKFFKFKHLKPSFLATLLPNITPFDSYLERVSQRKQKKFNSIFAGYRLAYEFDREGSGLLFIQLNPTHQSKQLTLIDKIGLERTVDLGSLPYIIQKRGETLRSVLTKLLDQGDLPSAKQRIDQIFDLYLSEYRLGLYDRDHGVMHNTGFIDNRAIHLDVGKMSKDDKMKQPEFYEKDLKKVVSRMIPWLQSAYPAASKELIAHIESRMSQLFNHSMQTAEI